MTRKPIDIIFAIDDAGGYGVYKDDKFVLPWQIPVDMKHFKDTTTYHEFPSKINGIVMGKNTWLSANGSLSSSRINVVISKTMEDKKTDCLVFPTLNDAIEKLNQQNDVETIFVIGGGQIIIEALSHPDMRYLYLTKIHEIYPVTASIAYDFMQHVKKIIWEDNMVVFNKMTGKDVNVTFCKYDCSKY